MEERRAAAQRLTARMGESVDIALPAPRLDVPGSLAAKQQLSADRAWLVVSGFFTVHVFDAADGASVFTRANMNVGYRVSDRVPVILPHRDRRGRAQRLSGRFVGNRLFVRGWTDGNPGEGVVEKFDLARCSGARSIERLEAGKATGESEQAFTLRTVLDPGSPTACRAFPDLRLAWHAGARGGRRGVVVGLPAMTSNCSSR